jgi:CRISPR-associated exonuclease Cas4
MKAEEGSADAVGLSPGSGGAQPVFTVTDLKQFAYCPRVVFYTYCLPLLRPMTYKMEESQYAHEEEAAREVRRSLRPYGLDDGERRFDVPLCSAKLGLWGKADMVVETATELIPVDYKSTDRKPGPHFRLQIAAYGIMLEEALPPDSGLVVQRGFLYSLTLKHADEVRLTVPLRAQVRRMAGAMREMVAKERMPEALEGRGRCLACEFRRFCSDL